MGALLTLPLSPAVLVGQAPLTQASNQMVAEARGWYGPRVRPGGTLAERQAKYAGEYQPSMNRVRMAPTMPTVPAQTAQRSQPARRAPLVTPRTRLTLPNALYAAPAVQVTPPVSASEPLANVANNEGRDVVGRYFQFDYPQDWDLRILTQDAYALRSPQADETDLQREVVNIVRLELSDEAAALTPEQRIAKAKQAASLAPFPVSIDLIEMLPTASGDFYLFHEAMERQSGTVYRTFALLQIDEFEYIVQARYTSESDQPLEYYQNIVREVTKSLVVDHSGETTLPSQQVENDKARLVSPAGWSVGVQDELFGFDVNPKNPAKNNAGFMVVSEMEEDARKLTNEELVSEALLDTLYEMDGAEVLSQTQTTVGGYPATQVIANFDEGLDKLYNVMYLARIGEEDMVIIDMTFDRDDADRAQYEAEFYRMVDSINFIVD